MNIPFFSFHKINTAVRQELSECFEAFIDEQRYILGSRVTSFEAEYAAYSNTGYCCGLGNGFDALVYALKALNTGPGDQVIVPSNTYIATWLAVSAVGAKIVPVEPRAATCNIDPELIEAAVTQATKTILPVHLYGQACEMEAILNIAGKHNLFVVEDNAQSQGATYKGQITGSFGVLNATSFYPTKNLGDYGDAGAITTNDVQLWERVKALRNFGSKIKYYNEECGGNSRLHELQAGLLSIRLRHLDDQNRERISIARQYTEQLKGTGDLQLPSLAAGATSVYHQYVIRTGRRDALMTHLGKHQIGTLMHYPVPPHLQKAYNSLGYGPGSFPIAEQIARQCLSLPIYPGLSADEISFVCQTIQGFYHG